MMKRNILTIIALTALFAVSTAADIKWGKPTMEELTMTTYDADPDAAAVVLARTTEIRYEIIGNALVQEITVKERVKVLTDDGKRYADGFIDYYYNDRLTGNCEQLIKLKGTAFNLTADGKIEKTKMTNATIHHEDATSHMRITKYAVPQVSAGTVFEVEYIIDSDLIGYIREWVAQDEIPVAYTDYQIIIPEYFGFNLDETGFCELEYDRKNTMCQLGGGRTCRGTLFRFTGHDLPALRDEDHVFGQSAYAHKVNFEMSQLQIPGHLLRNFSTKWEDVDKRLRESDNFGRRMGTSPLKNDLAGAGITAIEDPLARAAAVIQLVKSRVRWNNTYALTSQRSGKQTLQDGVGTNADINFLIINTLREAGITAYPAVLRDRAHGFLPFSRPSLDALTTMIVAINIGDRWHFYDGSAVDGCIDVIPAVLLADRARIIGDKGGTWCNPIELATGRHTVQVLANLEPDGSLSGTVTTKYTGLDAQSVRRRHRLAHDHNDYVDSIAAEMNIDIKSCLLTGLDTFNDEVIETIEFESHTSILDGELLPVPSILTIISRNPYKAGKRLLPVDFPYRSQVMVASNINLPEGYTSEGLETPLAVSIEEGQLAFMRQVQHREGMVNAVYRLTENVTMIVPTDYDKLVTFFDEVVKASTDMITVTKATD